MAERRVQDDGSTLPLDDESISRRHRCLGRDVALELPAGLCERVFVGRIPIGEIFRECPSVCAGGKLWLGDGPNFANLAGDGGGDGDFLAGPGRHLASGSSIGLTFTRASSSSISAIRHISPRWMNTAPGWAKLTTNRSSNVPIWVLEAMSWTS